MGMYMQGEHEHAGENQASPSACFCSVTSEGSHTDVRYSPYVSANQLNTTCKSNTTQKFPHGDMGRPHTVTLPHYYTPAAAVCPRHPCLSQSTVIFILRYVDTIYICNIYAPGGAVCPRRLCPDPRPAAATATAPLTWPAAIQLHNSKSQ